MFCVQDEVLKLILQKVRLLNHLLLQEAMSANRVARRPRKLLLLGKSLVYYSILSVPLDFSSVTIVMESILSQFLMFDFQ